MTPGSFAEGYVRPDLDELAFELRGLTDELGRAADPATALEAVRRANAVRSRLDTLRQIASVRYHQDTTDPAAKAEEEFWTEAAPTLRELDDLWARALLASAHGDAIDRAFGPQLLALKRCAAATFAPAIKDAIAEEARLVMRYTEVCAAPEIELRGERYNLMGIGAFFADADRGLRLEAHQARDAFLARKGEELDAIYDRLVELRDGMGRALGFPGYTPLGYRLMSRTTYGPAEVAAFREEILREIVPLAAALVAAQGERLGLDRVLFHDEAVLDPRGNPRPRGGVDFCLDAAARMYGELGAEFGEFFGTLRGRGLLDVENRPGKAGGGFCTVFADLGVPFVFANFNGTDGDVRVLTHECGHAFQVWRSRGQPLLEYRFPTYEACEIHSMSMEFLTWPWMGLFFGEDEAERFQRLHLTQALTSLPYMATVDHFQHEVYARPELSPAERGELWRELERRYLPWRDYGGALPYLERGMLWQRQLHVYVQPFYYIDYALAQTCALQFWRKAREDRARAIADYLAVCEPGGSLPFDGLVEVARIRSPFEPGCLRDVAAEARRALA